MSQSAQLVAFMTKVHRAAHNSPANVLLLSSDPKMAPAPKITVIYYSTYGHIKVRSV